MSKLIVAKSITRYALSQYLVQLMASLNYYTNINGKLKKALHHKFMIHPSTGVIESRTLSSIYYYYELLVTGSKCLNASLAGVYATWFR